MSEDTPEAENEVLPPKGETGPWGVLDTLDNVWLGTMKGPLVFNTYGAAYLSALGFNESLGWSNGRAKPSEYRVPANQMRDTIKGRMTVGEALDRLEQGRSLPALPAPRMGLTIPMKKLKRRK